MTTSVGFPSQGAAAASLPDAPAPLAPASQRAEEAMALVLRAREAGSGDGVAALSSSTRSAAAQEIGRRLHAMQRELALRTGDGQRKAWLLLLVAQIGHPTAADEIEVRVQTLASALAELPARCFTRRSAVTVAIACGRWFPDFAKLRQLLLREADDVAQEVGRLQRALAGLNAKTEESCRPTEEERAAMAEKARRRAAELRAAAAEKEAPPTRPTPSQVPMETLAALYRRGLADGSALADAHRTRLHRLDEQIATSHAAEWSGDVPSARSGTTAEGTRDASASGNEALAPSEEDHDVHA